MERDELTARSRLLNWQQEVNGRLDQLRNDACWVLDCRLSQELAFVNDKLHLRRRPSPLPDEEDKTFLLIRNSHRLGHDLRRCARDKCRIIFVGRSVKIIVR